MYSTGTRPQEATRQRGASALRRALLALALPLALVLPAPPASAALAPGVTHEAIFSNPFAATSKVDYRIHNRIVKMINETPAGATIRFSAWGLEHVPTADALIAAHRRGVLVYGVKSGHRPSAQSDRVKAVLGARYKICRRTVSDGVTNACMSKQRNGQMHAKSWLFSRTGTRVNVVVTGSTNPTNHGNESNDALIIAGDPDLYNGYVRYFNDRFAMRLNPNYMASPNGTLRAPKSATVSYFSARLTSTGTTGVEPSTSVTTQAATDPYVDALRRLAGGGGCSVKAAQRFWNSERRHVTAQVVRLKKAGCAVSVITDNMDGPTYRTLTSAGITVRATKRMTSTGRYVLTHHKFLVLEGTISGVANSREVWQGSQNLLGSSLRFTDDELVQVTHSPTVTAYETAFDRLAPYAYKLVY